MTIYNQEPFLDNVAKNLGHARRTKAVVRPKWSVAPQNGVYKGASQDELAAIFEKQCKVIHTDLKRTDRANLVETLREAVDDYEGKSIITSKDTRYHTFELTALFEELGKDRDVHIWDYTIGQENQKIAERADIGITFSDMTLAESGTVTNFNNKDNGRSISLLPRTYIAIIPKSTLVPRMTQATKEIHEMTVNEEDVASCVSFITGPSNSADIEMNLIVGVHGPVKVMYILIEDA